MDLRWQRNKGNILIFPIWQDILLLDSLPLPSSLLWLLNLYEPLHIVELIEKDVGEDENNA